MQLQRRLEIGLVGMKGPGGQPEDASMGTRAEASGKHPCIELSPQAGETLPRACHPTFSSL